MKYCANCGVQVPENATFCQSCGKPVLPPIINEQTPPPGPVFSAESDVSSNKLMAALSYIGLLVLIPLLVPTNSRFVRFHASQGLTLFVFGAASSLLSTIVAIPTFLSFGFGKVIFGALGGIMSFALWGVGVCLFVLTVIGIINVLNGVEKELPIIGKIKIIK